MNDMREAPSEIYVRLGGDGCVIGLADAHDWNADRPDVVRYTLDKAGPALGIGEKRVRLLFVAAMEALRSFEEGGNNRDLAKTIKDEIAALLELQEAKDSQATWN